MACGHDAAWGRGGVPAAQLAAAGKCPHLRAGRRRRQAAAAAKHAARAPAANAAAERLTCTGTSDTCGCRRRGRRNPHPGLCRLLLAQCSWAGRGMRRPQRCREESMQGGQGGASRLRCMLYSPQEWQRRPPPTHPCAWHEVAALAANTALPNLQPVRGASTCTCL